MSNSADIAASSQGPPPQLNNAPYTARTSWVSGVKFIGETGSGHAVVMDGPGGTNLGVRPMELFLMGLGGCTAVDVMWFLHGLEEKVTGCDIEIEGERAATPPQVFTRIRMRYIVTGHSLSAMKVKLAVKLSRDKFCSASAMLGKTAEITHEIEIRPTAPTTDPAKRSGRNGHDVAHVDGAEAASSS